MPQMKSPNPNQIAMYGHIAIALRQFLNTKGWKARDLNKAMGFDPGYSAGYQWINGKSAPGPEYRTKLAKLTGISEDKLSKRQPGKALVTLASLPALPAPRIKLASEVLSFSVASDGTARIKLDVSLPMHLANPLLRMLLDAGLVFSKDESNANDTN